MADRRADQKEPPRLLILSLNYAPEQVGIGPYSAGLAQMLARDGWAVTVVAGQPYYPEWIRRGRGWTRTVEHGVTVSRCPHYVPAKPSGARRLLHHFTFAKAAALPMLKSALRQRPDVVFAVAPSMMAFPIAWLAARLSGAKLWLHVQDFEVEAALATGLLAPAGLPARLAAHIERTFLRICDRVSTISPQMVAKLAEKGVARSARQQLRNWANHAPRIAHASGDGLRVEWGIGDRVVVLYSGNMAGKQGLETLVDAARLLSNETEILFILAGEGPSRKALEARAGGAAHITFMPLQPEDRFAELMRLADIHVLPQLAGAADLVLPSKLTNMLASGRPVVATAAPGTGLAQEVHGCGLIVPPEDSAALASAIKNLAADHALRAKLGAAAGERAAERWTAQAALRAFTDGARKLGVDIRG